MEWIDLINKWFSLINGWIAKALFFDVFMFLDGPLPPFPFAVVLLFLCALFFTFQMGFVNIFFFKHAIQLVLGKFDKKKKKEGEISHFKALMTALSATVGLGNIAGVAIAISIGGPGATFWMIVAGFFGMSTKFTECTLGVMYREQRSDGQLMGGPMEYLSKGLSKKGFPRIGKVLAIVFSCMCIGGSFGGGVAFQVNQSLNAISITAPFFNDYKIFYGVLMAFLVALVIIGGIKRIATVTSKIVPLMCGVYVLTALFIIISSYDKVPEALSSIFSEAFSASAMYGGFLGVLITGIQRAFFSNEAGLGSAPIAHSAAKVNHPIEEGFVALLGPFIDTILICTLTALVIIITGAHVNPEYAELIAQQKGAALTSKAMGSVLSWFPYVLGGSVFLFAFSTIISWSYYGERCFSFLFGEKVSIIYKILVLLVILLGSVATSVNVMEFGDLMILGMGIPNLLGVLILSGEVKKAFKDYRIKLKSN